MSKGATTTPSGIEIPYRLRGRPRINGLPVPANSKKDIKGVHDFAAIDDQRAMRYGQKRQCAMCAQQIIGDVAFAGGDNAGEAFIDGPMHFDCADFAGKVCPFLLGRRQYRSDEIDLRRHGNKRMRTSATMPKQMFIYIFQGYKMRYDPMPSKPGYVRVAYIPTWPEIKKIPIAMTHGEAQ